MTTTTSTLTPLIPSTTTTSPLTQQPATQPQPSSINRLMAHLRSICSRPLGFEIDGSMISNGNNCGNGSVNALGVKSEPAWGPNGQNRNQNGPNRGQNGPNLAKNDDDFGFDQNGRQYSQSQIKFTPIGTNSFSSTHSTSHTASANRTSHIGDVKQQQLIYDNNGSNGPKNGQNGQWGPNWPQNGQNGQNNGYNDLNDGPQTVSSPLLIDQTWWLYYISEDEIKMVWDLMTK